MPATRRQAARVSEVLVSIGANIRRLRVRRAWSIAGLAEATGFDHRHVQRIERAATRPSVPALVLFADALEVPVGRLFRKATPPAPKIGRPKKARPR